jgi:predicted flap endonuclease-1-like 5' DNA nuclease
VDCHPLPALVLAQICNRCQNNFSKARITTYAAIAAAPVEDIQKIQEASTLSRTPTPSIEQAKGLAK